MTGLLNKQQQPMIEPGRQPVAPEAGYQGEPNVSPEEQQAYERFIDNGFKIIYDEKTAPQILNRLKATDNPVEGLASVTVQVVTALLESARKQGRDIDPSVLFHGGVELLSDIADTAGKAGVHKYSEEDIENALYVAMDQYGTQEMERGTLHKDAIVEDFKALQNAEQGGQLDDVLGAGFTKHAQTLAQKEGNNGRSA